MVMEKSSLKQAIHLLEKKENKFQSFLDEHQYHHFDIN
jgi:hypothetical protein